MSARPPVRRTYGRRPPISSPPPSSSPAPTILYTPPSSSLALPPSSPGAGPSSPLRNNHKRPRLSTPDAALPSLIGDADPILLTPPRKRPLANIDDNRPTTQSSLKGFFVPLPKKRSTSPKRATAAAARATTKPPPPPSDAPRPKLTQLHFTQGSLRSCTDCGMSFVRGGEDDAVHEQHHARVTRGIPWDGLATSGRPRLRAGASKESGWRVIRDGVPIRGTKGVAKLVLVDGSWGGAKLDDIFTTVDTVLSAPALPPSMRGQCKLILAVTSAPPPTTKRLVRKKDDGKDRVVGVVVAQHIKWAMRVLRKGETTDRSVDSGDGVVCDPKPLPTPLGIHRLFTVPAYRGTGLARAMLDAAAEHTVYGCEFDPVKGEVAFSQPTDSGRAVMERWGGGGVRVFVDDESQL